VQKRRLKRATKNKRDGDEKIVGRGVRGLILVLLDNVKAVFDLHVQIRGETFGLSEAPPFTFT